MDSRHPTSARRVVVAVLTDHLFGFSTKYIGDHDCQLSNRDLMWQCCPVTPGAATAVHRSVGRSMTVLNLCSVLGGLSQQ